MQEAIETPFHTWLQPVGYADPATDNFVASLMAQYPSLILLDVRLRARSRWYPAWNKTALCTRWGERYVHEPRLGNVNYQYLDRPIVLADPASAVAWIVPYLQQGFSFCVFCACKNYDTCHRKVVVDYLLQACKEVPIDGHNNH